MRNENNFKEEQPHTQRFSITIVWSRNSVETVSPDDVQSIVQDALSEIDSDVTVEVSEVLEPMY